MSVGRRTFLRLTGLTAAGTLGAAGWWSSCASLGSTGSVHAALRQARRAGKPLLVLLVPEDESLRDARGQLLGTLLGSADEVFWAELALAEVICATRAEVLAAVPQVAGRGEPLALLIESDGAPRARVLDPDLGRRPDWQMDDSSGETWEAFRDRVELEAVHWVAPLAGAIRRALAGDADLVAARVAQARAALDRASLEACGSALAASAELPHELADRCAALALAHGEEHPARRAACRTALAAAARARIWQNRIPGSRWAVNDGCGVQIEGEEGACRVACGMGFTPEPSKRFLEFYTRSV